LFPLLLYIIFADESLIALTIETQLHAEAKDNLPVNPNIPHARAVKAEEGSHREEEAWLQLVERIRLEEIMNPFLDIGTATLSTIVIVIMIIVLLAQNAIYLSSGGHPDYWVALPAAFVMFSRDIISGWCHRNQTREIFRKGREKIKSARAERERREEDERSGISELTLNELPPMHGRQTLMSLSADACRWSQETFSAATAVLKHLPYSLVPFALSMFVLVQALVNNGWVPLFAHGWIKWVNMTGTVGSIAGMGFISVILCNVSFHTYLGY
jgi:Na+/H+ antiporter NhaD/arsenite permease-like protein